MGGLRGYRTVLKLGAECDYERIDYRPSREVGVSRGAVKYCTSAEGVAPTPTTSSDALLDLVAARLRGRVVQGHYPAFAFGRTFAASSGNA